MKTLAHEAWHLNGYTNEAVTECRGLCKRRRKRRSCSARTPARRRRPRRTRTRTYYPLLPTDYRTADCRDGGPDDLRPGDPVFPSPGDCREHSSSVIRERSRRRASSASRESQYAGARGRYDRARGRDRARQRGELGGSRGRLRRAGRSVQMLVPAIRWRPASRGPRSARRSMRPGSVRRPTATTPSRTATSGLVAYLEGEPVGWCAVEPRTAYPRMLRNVRVPWEGGGTKTSPTAASGP